MFRTILSYFQAAKALPEKIRKALFTYQITRSPLWRIKVEMDTYRQALDMARNPIRYERKPLYAIYRDVELDDQVVSQRRIACSVVQRAPFEVLKGKKPSDDLKAHFTRPWFNDLMEVMVVTEFWGHSLIEFDPTRDDKGEFKCFSLIERDHVRPNYGDVVLRTTDFEGISFRGNPAFQYTLEIGRPDDLGLYHIVAIPYIRKKYADTDWSLFSERFGSPFLTIKTASRDKSELDAKEAMASRFASNGYAILDDQDTVETIVTNHNGTAHRTFSERIDKADQQIAKVMNGQTGTSEEKAYVGSAEVHERILNDFTFARLIRIQYFINFNLIPFLVYHGYSDLKEASFEFTELREKQPEKESSTDGAEDMKKDEEKKKPKLNASALSLHYNPYFHQEDCNCPACQEST